MPLLSEVRSEALSAGSTRRAPSGIQITPILFDSERLWEVQLDDPVECLWGPSSFDENSERQTVTFSLSTQRNAEEVGRFEDAVMKQLGLNGFNSSLKRRDEKYVLKAKCRTDSVHYVDADGKPTTEPAEWHKWVMKVILSPKAYILKNTGITWELVAVQLLSQIQKPPPVFR